jgi:methionyl-tRNA formyltransferase
MGTPEPAVPALEAILAAGHEVPLVVTQPDRPAGRSKSPRPPPVKTLALARGLTVLQPETVRAPEFRDAVAAAAPEVIAVVAYGRKLPRPVLETAPHGAVNLHFSLLPAYRGAAPVQWALAHGDEATGVTTFRLDEGLDTGDVLLQRPLAIQEGENAPALLLRLAAEGARVLVDTLAGLSAGTIRPIPQDSGKATLAPLLRREHGRWDPAWSARQLAGRVRGFEPWPGVWALRGGHRIRIAEAAEQQGIATAAPAGTLLDLEGDAVRLACAGGTVALIHAIQPEGGRTMRAKEAVNGRRLAPGDRLGRPEPEA